MERKRLGRVVGRVGLGLVFLLVLLLVFVKVRYGGGEVYPDLSGAPFVAEGDVRVLVSLPYPPGNVTSGAGGRIFFNTHPFTQSHRFTDAFMFELVDGVARPYPDLASQRDLQFVFGMTVDRQNRLWLVSPATLDRAQTRLIAYDLTKNEKVVDHLFEPGVARFSQDLRVSPDGKTLYFADTGAFRFTHASILLVDVDTFRVREVLGHDPSTQPQNWTIRTAHGPHRVGYGLLTFQVGVDGIALSKDGEWLYYATMSHDTLYRVRTSFLRDESLSEAALASHIEPVGKKPLSDGIEVAADGSVLITDIEHGSIAAMDASGHLRTLARRGEVVWSDGVNVMENGDVLFTDSDIPTYIDQLLRPPAKEQLEAKAPHRIYRFAGVGGR